MPGCAQYRQDMDASNGKWENSCDQVMSVLRELSAVTTPAPPCGWLLLDNGDLLQRHHPKVVGRWPSKFVPVETGVTSAVRVVVLRTMFATHRQRRPILMRLPRLEFA